MSGGGAFLSQALVRCAMKGKEGKGHSGMRGRAWEREPPKAAPGEGGDGSRWQRGVMDDAAHPASLQPIFAIPLLRPTTRT